MTTETDKGVTMRRRRALKVLAAAGMGASVGLDLIAESKVNISVPILRDASAILGENFSEERLQVIQVALQRNLDQFQIVRDFEVDDPIEPAPMFVTNRYKTAKVSPNNSVHEPRHEVSHG